jgi:hypothetical protein
MNKTVNYQMHPNSKEKFYNSTDHRYGKICFWRIGFKLLNQEKEAIKNPFLLVYCILS